MVDNQGFIKESGKGKDNAVNISVGNHKIFLDDTYTPYFKVFAWKNLNGTPSFEDSITFTQTKDMIGTAIVSKTDTHILKLRMLKQQGGMASPKNILN